MKTQRQKHDHLSPSVAGDHILLIDGVFFYVCIGKNKTDHDFIMLLTIPKYCYIKTTNKRINEQIKLLEQPSPQHFFPAPRSDTSRSTNDLCRISSRAPPRRLPASSREHQRGAKQRSYTRTRPLPSPGQRPVPGDSPPLSSLLYGCEVKPGGSQSVLTPFSALQLGPDRSLRLPLTHKMADIVELGPAYGKNRARPAASNTGVKCLSRSFIVHLINNDPCRSDKPPAAVHGAHPDQNLGLLI